MSPLRPRPSISALIPTHQAEQFLLQTLESIASQTQPITQLVISDDSSTDGTMEIIRDFRNTAEFEIVLVDHTPNGVTANYLNALAYATGEIIIVSDQDDIWLDEKVAKTLASFRQQKVQLVCHDSELVDANLNSMGVTLRGNQVKSRRLSNEVNSGNDAQNFIRFLKGGLPLLAHTLSIRRSLVPEVLNKPNHIDGWWFEEWVSSVAAMLGRIRFIADSLILYRQHAAQASGGYAKRPEYSPIQQGVAGPRLSKYHGRLEKMIHCLELLKRQSSESKFKQEILKEYIDFLHSRDQVLEQGLSISSVLTNWQLLLSGRYQKLANGLRSFLLDASLMLRQSKR